VSQEQLAASIGRSQSDVSRLESLRGIDRISVVDLAVLGSVLGLELGAGFHPAGQPIRDKGQQAVIARLRRLLSAVVHVIAEAPFPNPGDPRRWDLLLRLPQQVIGIEVETRIRDIQALVARLRRRALEGGANVLVLVLADTKTNRALLPQLLEALGDDFGTSPRLILKALRAGQAVPGSGVVLL
jgi:hypothetical protein